uniref:Uncharacterized protein n=1 Tax=Marseillevirus LCMAC101 TaxID=2506602 RepID=A0A481YRH2_9VIRU|nr:MAG: hypothetical protein LCMAC101_04160 [Marseillevirus LCMAC101]
METHPGKVKLEVLYYWKVHERNSEGEPKKIAKRRIFFYFPPDKPCHEVHKALCRFAESKVVLFADGKCMMGGTVEKSLVGKELVMFNQETTEVILKKSLELRPPSEHEEITMEDVVALRERYYST